MKKRSAFLIAAVLLVGCNEQVPLDPVESLMADPEHLKLLAEQCHTDHAKKLGDRLCNLVAEAAKRRFLGGGGRP